MHETYLGHHLTKSLREKRTEQKEKEKEKNERVAPALKGRFYLATHSDLPVRLLFLKETSRRRTS